MTQDDPENRNTRSSAGCSCFQDHFESCHSWAWSQSGVLSTRLSNMPYYFMSVIFFLILILFYLFISFLFLGHRLEFIIGDHVLPYDMTVYQAVQQFGSAPMYDMTQDDPENRNTSSSAGGSMVMYGSPGIWARIHTIYYRPVTSTSVNSNVDGAASQGSHSSLQGKNLNLVYKKKP